MRLLALAALLLLGGCTMIRGGCVAVVEVTRTYSCESDGQLWHVDHVIGH